MQARTTAGDAIGPGGRSSLHAAGAVKLQCRRDQVLLAQATI